MDITANPPFGGSELLSFAASLIIVVGVIAILGWLYSRSRSFTGPGANLISIVATRALGTRERLLLVEVADQQLLVGITSTQVQTLHVFDKPVVQDVKSETVPAESFATRLKSALWDVEK